MADEDRWQKMNTNLPAVAENGEPDEAAAAAGSSSDAAPINENLFLDEDLEGIDDELSDDDEDDDDDANENSEKSWYGAA